MSSQWIRTAAFLLTLLGVAPGARGYYEYQAKIPNGARVPHPCKDNFLWHGVGHFSVQGGGPRSQFGLDFAAAGHTWTSELCRKDSDGDGKSNGEELGDPECIWTPGQVPQSTAGISHPGVCDPYRGAACSRKAVPQSLGVSYATVADWIQEACASAGFDCPAIDGEDVQEVDLRIPITPAPAQETTYMCMSFEWPDVTKDYHVIATEPIINNSYIMHHMLLFGCPDYYPVTEETPWECGMGQCTELVGAWGLGITGHCFHRDTGVLVGTSGLKKFMIQYHWNNPQLHSHFTDSSGMKLYYTSSLRPNNMAMLMTGQIFIHIPPRTPHTFVTADCTPACTRALMTGDIKITTALNHMHYLGRSMNLELHRDGRFLMNFTNEPIFRYDTPKFHDFPDPVTVKPGDMIRTNCHYSSLDKDSTTRFGDGTLDEMCFGFFTFYPRENMPTTLSCVSWKGYSACDEATYGACTEDVRNSFSKSSFNEMALYRHITSVCKPFGLCTEECKQAIRIARKCDPCLSNPDMWDMVRWDKLPATDPGWVFSASWASCDTELYAESLTNPCLSDNIVCGEGNSTLTEASSVLGSCAAKKPREGSSGGGSVFRSSGLGMAGLGFVLGTLYLALYR